MLNGIVRITVDRDAMKPGAAIPPIVVKDPAGNLLDLCFGLEIIGPSRVVYDPDPKHRASNGNKRLWIEADYNTLRFINRKRVRHDHTALQLAARLRESGGPLQFELADALERQATQATKSLISEEVDKILEEERQAQERIDHFPS